MSVMSGRTVDQLCETYAHEEMVIDEENAASHFLRTSCGSGYLQFDEAGCRASIRLRLWGSPSGAYRSMVIQKGREPALAPVFPHTQS
jgi:hypothetical protein